MLLTFIIATIIVLLGFLSWFAWQILSNIIDIGELDIDEDDTKLTNS